MAIKADCPKCGKTNCVRVLQYREFPSIRAIVNNGVGPEIGTGDEEITEEFAECEECYAKFVVEDNIVHLDRNIND